MKFAKLTIAAALGLSVLSLSGTASAQAYHRDRGHHGWNDRHHGWNHGRPGWGHNRAYRRCWTVWRHHHRERVCRWVRR